MSDPSGSREVRREGRILHREMVQLGVLALVSVVAFLVTRAVAAGSREIALRDAEAWYRVGRRQLASGDLEGAVDSLRRAAARHRGEKTYGLALAEALTALHDYDSASQVLLNLRETEPDDPGIDLELARLAVRRQDFPGALKYYRQTLSADWPAEQIAARRDVRFELIAVLLERHQNERALSELMALDANLPDRASTLAKAATLFARAGDERRALAEFQRALRLAPDDRDVLAGAGRSAFELGEYETARAYLRRAPPGAAPETLETADLVVTGDPLAKRIGSAERGRRLADALAYATTRLSACADRTAGAASTGVAQALAREAQALQTHVKNRMTDQDTIEAGVELVSRMVHEATDVCGPATTRDRALVLIARRHGADAR